MSVTVVPLRVHAVFLLSLSLLAAGEDFDTRAGSPGLILITAADTPYKSFPGDHGLATPFTFSWARGSPTKTAVATQSGLYTSSNKVGKAGFAATVKLAGLDITTTEVRAFVGT